MMITNIFKKVTDKWFICVDHINYGNDPNLKNCYNVYIRYNYKNFIWKDIECTRNQLMYEIYKLKRKMLIETKLKPYRMEHNR